MFGSDTYRPTQCGRGWLEAPAALDQLRAAGFRLGTNYRVKSAAEWRVALHDPANGILRSASPRRAELWHSNTRGDASPEQLEELIESLIADVRRRTMAKRATLQRLFLMAEAEDAMK